MHTNDTNFIRMRLFVKAIRITYN